MDLYAREVNLRTKSFMSFSTSIGKKNENGEYDNVYFDVLFKKNEAPDVDEGRLQIKINSGFLTLSVYNDGSVHPAVMVMDYEPIYDDDDELPDWLKIFGALWLLTVHIKCATENTSGGLPQYRRGQISDLSIVYAGYGFIPRTIKFTRYYNENTFEN